MLVNDHYLTSAAFFLKDQSDRIGFPIVDCSAGTSLYGKGLIRKLCICGSKVVFDEDVSRWLCSDSGAELDLRPWNPEPVLPPEVSSQVLQPYRAEFSNQERESVIVIDEADHPLLFVKVPDEKVWVIQDPLPVFDNLTIKPMYTDLILNWSLDIGDSSTGDIYVEILLNILDPVHEKFVDLLASGSVVDLHFFHANSLLALGHKRIIPSPIVSHIVEEARSVLRALPKETAAREAALHDIATAQEVTFMAFAESAGLCLEPFFLLKRNRSKDIQQITAELEEHQRKCERCQRNQKNQNFE